MEEVIGVYRGRRGHPTLGTIFLVHGFGVNPRGYSELIRLWNDDGWTVYSPHLYGVCTPVGEEVSAVYEGALYALDALPRPLILAGHSRGGQAVMCAMLDALHHVYSRGSGWEPHSEQSTQHYLRLLEAVKGIVLLDPVEGKPKMFGRGLKHFILGEKASNWLWKDTPVLIVGGKLGTLGPVPAAPKGHNYMDFHDALHCANRVSTFIPRAARNRCFYMAEVESYGHMDYLNDSKAEAGAIAALAQFVVPGSTENGEKLREFCRTATTLIFGGATYGDLHAALSSITPY